MSYMFEVLYASPPDSLRETIISECVGEFGGRLTFREAPKSDDVGPICLTFEFTDRQIADKAASYLRSQGEHVEGPMDYGND